MNSKTEPADTIESPRRDPRLPPGQVKTEKWPVLQHGEVPKLDTATWDLKVGGLVERPLHWTYDQFRAQPRIQVRSDIHCVTRWSRYDNLWEGVSIRDVMRQVEPKAEARFAVIHADPGYSTNLPVEELLADDVLLADLHDGQQLTAEHGFPVRLVVPRRYFWKSAKWIRAIELVADDQPGFWEQNGYHNEADPWKEERFSDW